MSPLREEEEKRSMSTASPTYEPAAEVASAADGVAAATAGAESETDADSENEGQPYITAIRSQDILLGRGAPMSTYKGNIKFRALIAEYQDEYTSAKKRPLKDVVARRILNACAQRRARFLRKIETTEEEQRLGVPEGVTAWVEAHEDVAIEKIKQALRHGQQMSRSNSESSLLRRSNEEAAAAEASVDSHRSSSGAPAPVASLAVAPVAQLVAHQAPLLNALAPSPPQLSVPLFGLANSQVPTSTMAMLLAQQQQQQHQQQQQQQLYQQIRAQQVAVALGQQQQDLFQMQQYQAQQYQAQQRQQQILQAAAFSGLLGQPPPSLVNAGTLASLNPHWNPLVAQAPVVRNPPLQVPSPQLVAAANVAGGAFIGTSHPPPAAAVTAPEAPAHEVESPSRRARSSTTSPRRKRKHKSAVRDPAVDLAAAAAEAVRGDDSSKRTAPTGETETSLSPTATQSFVRNQATANLIQLQHAISLELLNRNAPANHGVALHLPASMAENERPSSISSNGDKSSGSSKHSGSSTDNPDEDRKPRAQSLAEPAAAAPTNRSASSDSSTKEKTTKRRSSRKRQKVARHSKA